LEAVIIKSISVQQFSQSVTVRKPPYGLAMLEDKK
jgi:hypothetical protein